MTISPNSKGTCPHCKTPNRFEHIQERRGTHQYDYSGANLVDGYDTQFFNLNGARCTECGKIILFFNGNMIYPLGGTRQSAPVEVPQNIAIDFNEASLVENLSPKAAAALARRCLQGILHSQDIKKHNLNQEIDEAMKSLPSHLSSAIDAIRNVGNFAAHPIKSTHTGDIVEVEAGETEWILDVLEDLFDFYYVAPAKTKLKQDALNKKLKEAGKPELKS